MDAKRRYYCSIFSGWLDVPGVGPGLYLKGDQAVDWCSNKSDSLYVGANYLEQK